MTRIELNLNWLLYMSPNLKIDSSLINVVWPTSTRLSGYIMRSHPDLVPKQNTMPGQVMPPPRELPAPEAPAPQQQLALEPPREEMPMSEDEMPLIEYPALPMSEDELDFVLL